MTRIYCLIDRVAEKVLSYFPASSYEHANRLFENWLSEGLPAGSMKEDFLISLLTGDFNENSIVEASVKDPDVPKADILY